MTDKDKYIFTTDLPSLLVERKTGKKLYAVGVFLAWDIFPTINCSVG